VWHSHSDYRQNVVLVGAGRISRSARIATSSELLYLLNLLYNMPSECCVEYILIQLYQKSSVWCFAFSHASTFELIPAVASVQPGAVVTIGREYGLHSLNCLHSWQRDNNSAQQNSPRDKLHPRENCASGGRRRGLTCCVHRRTVLVYYLVISGRLDLELFTQNYQNYFVLN